MKRLLTVLLLGALLISQTGCETWQRAVGAELVGIDVSWII